MAAACQAVPASAEATTSTSKVDVLGAILRFICQHNVQVLCVQEASYVKLHARRLYCVQEAQQGCCYKRARRSIYMLITLFE